MTNTVKFMGDSNPLGLQSVDTWHQAQHLAFSGKTSQAIKQMQSAAKQALEDSDPGMAKYMLATAAWLANDIPTVEKYISDPDVVSTGSSEVLKRLLSKTGSYRDVYLSEIDAESELDAGDFSIKNLLARSHKDGEIEGNDIMLATSGNVSVYSLVINGEVAALLGLEGAALRNIKNFSKSPGVIRALIGYLVHIKRQQINILETEPLTPDGLRWLMYLIDNPRGLKVTDRMGHSLESETVKKEWLAARSSGVAGNTAVVISENIEFGNKIRLNETRRSDTLLMPFKFYSIGNNRMKKQPKQGILRKTVNEGRYTINARTGERLHPKTGEPLPAKEKPLTMKQMFAQKPAAKKPAGLSLDQGMGESYDEYEDDEQQDEGFFVVIGDEEDYSVFIGMLVKEGGKWRERTYSGNPPTNWGGTYMGYLTPQDVMSWLQKDYGRNYQVDGPFDSEEEAIQHADMLREAAPSIKPRVVNPDTRADILSRRKALQAIIMDPDTARDPALRREIARKKAELARMEREAGMVSEDQGGAVEAYGYAYNRKDQRVTWRRVFKSAEAAQAWAAKRNATVLGTRPVDGKQQGISEGPNDGKEDNFTIDDIKNLEQIQDLETLKARAKELIKGKPARRMKPEKISWFYNHIDNLKRPLDVIKMMYDLLLAGEGNKVIGTRHTMANNSYRQRFGEQSVEEGYDTSENNREYFDTVQEWAQAVDDMGGDVIKARGVYVAHGWYGEMGEFDTTTGEGWLVSKVYKEGSVESASEWIVKHWDKQAEAISAPLGEALGPDAYTITQRDKNSYVVGTRETRGPVLDIAYGVFKELVTKKGVSVFTKLGKALLDIPHSHLFVMARKPNLVYRFEDPTNAEAILKSAIDAAARSVDKEQEKKKKHRDEAPLRRKQAAAYSAERRKADMAKYDAKYGKGTWNRVTYRQEGGDDGYQYVVRVDGRPYMNGLTRREAEYYKLQQVKAIAKRERLGSYANIAPAAPDDTGVTEAARGHTIEAHGIRGMQNKTWHKTFKNREQMLAWAEKYDAEIHATRDLEQASRGNLSPALPDKGIEEGQGYWNDAVKKAEMDREARKGKPFERNPASHGERVSEDKQYEMMMRNGQVKKFVAKDDAEAKRIAKGNGAKSVIRLRGGVPAGKVLEQGVAEGFGDVVKGIKRKVAGKEDPKEVEHMYGRIARSAIKHKTPDQAEKDIGRYKKVAKVVNKKG